MQVGLQPALPSLLSPEQPGSAKMVSLDLLLGSNSTPATPRDPDLLPVRRRSQRPAFARLVSSAVAVG